MAGGYNPKVSAQQLAQNRRSAWIFAAAISGLISIFIIAHFTKILFQLSSSRPCLITSRLYRRIFLRKLPKFTSGGHLALILAYLGCNVAITLYDVPIVYPYSFFAKRCGWLAVNNACLAFLLAMKNNPLSFLTGYSHERLNVLHRWVGRVIFVYSCLHVYVFVYSYVSRNNTEKLKEESIIWGWVAFAAFNVIYASSLHFIRKRFYEFFYIIHVVMFLIAVIFMGMHKPKKFAEVMYFAGATWSVDRLIRWLRMLYNSYNNTATLIPLSGLATKVVLSKPMWSQPGSHAFLSIPTIRGFQTHPFTISSSSAVEFIIKAQKGFTLDLHKYALKHPGAKVKVCLDGPYGAVPDFGRFNRVVLIAGGSGGAFTFSVAMDLVRNTGRFGVVSVDMIWVIRDERHLTWYESEIEVLQNSPLVNLRIYVTSQTDALVTTQPVESLASSKNKGTIISTSSTHLSPNSYTQTVTATTISRTGGKRTSTLEQRRVSQLLESQIDQRPRIKIQTIGGRPDLSEIVKGAVGAAEERDMVAVAACGPVELMRVTRNAVADSIGLVGGASVTLHCEQFGWG
ncbi:ferric reductase NAD binding domain-containing protein [Peziza echinospora]|nr:ferric reductase NAD binding domain-containing protein [Peziza echinospora]